MSNKSEQSLKDHLLIADPSLSEGIFHRSVIHISEHTDSDGAVGCILNKPTDRVVGEVLTEPEFTSLATIPVYFGGPVGLDHLVFSAYWWHEDKLRYKIRISADEATGRMGLHGNIVVAHVGYAAWDKGQLESEILDHAWITTKAPSNMLSIPSEDLWKEVLADMSPYHKLLSMTPDNIGSN